LSSTATFFATISAQGGCADVIFVHGLTGDPVDTWSSDGVIEQEGPYWPKWLLTDLPHLDFYTLGFPASLFAQWAKKEMNLFQRAKNVLELLAAYGFGSRPIVFVCHSLGGLLVKQILRTAKESTDDAWHKIADNCRGVLFLATPHSGSSLADLLKAFSVGFSSPHVDKLLKDTSELEELNESFRSFCKTRDIHVTAYYEMHKAHKLATIVEAKSADPGVNAAAPIPIDADHISICRPSGRHNVIYLSIRRKLSDLLPNVSPDQHGPLAFDEDNFESESARSQRPAAENDGSWSGARVWLRK
jgi:pimeloyl-ACP methyl ester carboxylesterase